MGICGKVVAKNGQPALIKEISSMNIRFNKEIKGCANVLLPQLLTGSEPQSVLIVSPPGCGKTTLLRDIARLLSMRQRHHSQPQQRRQKKSRSKRSKKQQQHQN